MDVSVSGNSNFGIPTTWQRTIIDIFRAPAVQFTVSVDVDDGTGLDRITYQHTDTDERLSFLGNGLSAAPMTPGSIKDVADELTPSGFGIIVKYKLDDFSIVLDPNASVSLSHLASAANDSALPASPHNHTSFYGILFPSPAENVRYNGFKGKDVAEGSEFDDKIETKGGNDFIYVTLGRDILDGGAGREDTFSAENLDPKSGIKVNLTTEKYGATNSFVFASGKVRNFENADGTSNKDVITGTAGKNKLKGRGGDDKIRGEDGNDRLFGDDGDDRLSGGNGNDFIKGGGGDDELFGEFGNDRLFGGSGKDKLAGGAGDDFLSGGTGDDQLLGHSGDDTLIGGSGDDELMGGEGADLLYGGDGQDKMYGGSDPDIFLFRKSDKFGGKPDIVHDFSKGEDTLKFRGLKASDVTIQHAETKSGTTFSKISYIDSDGVRAKVFVFGDDVSLSDLVF